MTYKTKTEGKDGVDLLDIFLAEGTMSDELRNAIQELKQAILSENLTLASTIRYGIEQHIVGTLDADPAEYAFRESDTLNEYFIGKTIYDTMSYMGLYSCGRPREAGYRGPVKEHPVVKRIQYEHEQCIIRAAVFHSEIGLDKLPKGWKVVRNEPKSDYSKDNPIGRLIEVTDGKTLLTLDCEEHEGKKRFAISKRTMGGKKLANVEMAKHDCGAMLTREDIWPASEALVDAAKWLS